MSIVGKSKNVQRLHSKRPSTILPSEKSNFAFVPCYFHPSVMERCKLDAALFTAVSRFSKSKLRKIKEKPVNDAMFHTKDKMSPTKNAMLRTKDITVLRTKDTEMASTDSTRISRLGSYHSSLK